MMPRIVQQLIDVLGYDDAITIVSRWGGAKVYIPDSIAGVQGSQLTNVIGVEKVMTIATQIGTGQIDIPLCASMLAAQRNTEIFERYEAGELVMDLALRFRMTERSIYRILKGTKNV